jgi:hypothetical protein
MHKKFWWGNLKDIYYLEDFDVDGIILPECVLEKQSGKLWTVHLAQGK